MNSPPASNTTCELAITGITCAACAQRVEKALQKSPSVAAVSVNVATDSAHLEIAADASLGGALNDAVQAVEKAGYGDLIDLVK